MISWNGTYNFWYVSLTQYSRYIVYDQWGFKPYSQTSNQY